MGTKTGTRGSDAPERIMRFFDEQNASMTAEDIADALGIAVRTVRHHCADLVSFGRLEVVRKRNRLYAKAS